MVCLLFWCSFTLLVCAVGHASGASQGTVSSCFSSQAGSTQDCQETENDYCMFESNVAWSYDNYDISTNGQLNGTQAAYQCATPWQCDAFNANNARICSNVSFDAHILATCDHVLNGSMEVDTSDGSLYTVEHLSYFGEKQCCQEDNCNNNGLTNETSDQCENSELFGDFNGKYLECLTSEASLSQSYAQALYCRDSIDLSDFINDRQYCEFIGSFAYLEFGCECESLSFLWNRLKQEPMTHNISDLSAIYSSLTNRINSYSASIQDLVNSFGYCCEINVTCNLHQYDASSDSSDSSDSGDSRTDSVFDVEITWYFVTMHILVNDTTRGNYDETELIDTIADQVNVFRGEIVIADKVFPESNGEAKGFLLAEVVVYSACQWEATQLIADLINGTYDFGSQITITAVEPDYKLQVVSYEDGVLSDEPNAKDRNKNNDGDDTLRMIIWIAGIAALLVCCLGVCIWCKSKKQSKKDEAGAVGDTQANSTDHKATGHNPNEAEAKPLNSTDNGNGEQNNIQAIETDGSDNEYGKTAGRALV